MAGEREIAAEENKNEAGVSKSGDTLFSIISSSSSSNTNGEPRTLKGRGRCSSLAKAEFYKDRA